MKKEKKLGFKFSFRVRNDSVHILYVRLTYNGTNTTFALPYQFRELPRQSEYDNIIILEETKIRRLHKYILEFNVLSNPEIVFHPSVPKTIKEAQAKLHSVSGFGYTYDLLLVDSKDYVEAAFFRIAINEIGQYILYNHFASAILGVRTLERFLYNLSEIDGVNINKVLSKKIRPAILLYFLYLNFNESNSTFLLDWLDRSVSIKFEEFIYKHHKTIISEHPLLAQFTIIPAKVLIDAYQKISKSIGVDSSRFPNVFL